MKTPIASINVNVLNIPSIVTWWAVPYSRLVLSSISAGGCILLHLQLSFIVESNRTWNYGESLTATGTKYWITRMAKPYVLFKKLAECSDVHL